MTDHFLRSLGDIQEEQEARLEREMDPDMALVSDYVTGDLSEEQARAVRERIATDADFRDLAEPLLIAAEHGPRFQPIPREQLERKWLELRRRIGLPDLARDPRTDPSLDSFRRTIAVEKRRSRRNWVLGIAALILFILLPNLIGGYRDIQDNLHRTTEWGSAEIIALPDGSRATLSMGSKLSRIPYGAERTWILRGEATFEVVPSGTRFIVETESANVIVTGTRFAVHAYRGEPTVVTVAEGSVHVQAKDADDEPIGPALQLSPGQKARAVRGLPAERIP